MTMKKKHFNDDISIAIKTVRYFIPVGWQIKKNYFILMTLNLIFNAIQPFIDIIILPLIIDELINERRLEVISIYIVVLVLGGGILSRLISFTSMSADKASSLFENHLNEILVKRTMEIDFALTENKEALDQIEKAKEGIGWYSGGIPGIVTPFLDLIKNIFVIGGIVVLIAVNAPVMLLITLIVVFIKWLVNKKLMRIEIESFKNLSKVNRSFSYTLFELLEFKYAKDIRLYGAVGMMMNKTAQEIKGLTKIWRQQASQYIPWNVISSLVDCVNNGIMYMYLGILTILGKITIGIFTQMVSAVSTFSFSIQNVVNSFQTIIKRSAYANEFIKFMEYPAIMQTGNKIPASIPHIIEFIDVSFSYPGTDVKILDHVSIHIKTGEHLSIIGLNGAGKTTFIKLLCRLYDVDSGEILLDGINIKEYQYEEYMKLFSVVFQDYKLLSFTLKENIVLDNIVTEEEINSICKIADINDKIHSLKDGLDTILFKSFDKDGVDLSGGEQQKIAIARALYKNSPIVILDEPTAALDPMAEYEIYRQFDQLVGGKTAIYISHRLSSCKFCDTIAVFSEGTIKEYGPHEVLINISNGIYAKMFMAQAQYYL